MVTGGTEGALYRTIRRWHFYAGLFVLPFILILSITGSIYLFKPQIDRWEERAYRGFGEAGAAPADRLLAVALAANPGARFNQYRLPERSGDAAMIELILADGGRRDVYVSPQGALLGAVDPDRRISETVARIHGSLLLGRWGDRLVELAASWTIVMILTGLYLWWPRPFRAGGVLYPRLSLKGRALLRDIHAVTGFWIAGLVLLMLASGLPWAGAWGTAFKWVRTELNLMDGPPDWKIGAGSDEAHDHHGTAMVMPAPPVVARGGLPLSAFVTKAAAEHLAFPALVLPPHAQQRFGPPTGNVWTVKSEAQNRLLDRQVSYDPVTGVELARSGFADKHVIDRAVSIGIAWHEGQLFGPANQLLGVVTALGLVCASIIGVLAWLRRRPRGRLGAPPAGKAGGPPVIAAIMVLAILLPLFGLSLIGLLLAERLVTAIIPRRAV